MEARIRDRLELAGFTGDDLAWFESFDGDDARVPEPRPDEIADYRRREAALNASIKPLTFAERGESAAGKLAAAIGARVADAMDPPDSDD